MFANVLRMVRTGGGGLALLIGLAASAEALAAPTIGACVATEHPFLTTPANGCPGTGNSQLCRFNNATSTVDCDLNRICDDTTYGAVAYLIENDDPQSSATDYALYVSCENAAETACCIIDDPSLEVDTIQVKGTDQRDFLYLRYDPGTNHPFHSVGATHPVTGELKGGLGDDFLVATDPASGEEPYVKSLLRGESGDDHLLGLTDADECYGGSGIDFVDAGDDDDIVNGDGDGDMLVGNRNADTMHGNEGDDLMCDETYTDTAGTVPDLGEIMRLDAVATSADPATYSIACAAQSTGAAADNMYGDEDHDAVYCFRGDDIVDLGSGDDYAETGDGDDTVLLGGGTDTVFSGGDNDRICEKTADTTGLSDDIDAGSGNDSVYLHYGQSFTGAADLGFGSNQECAPWDGSSNPYTTSGGGTLTDCDIVINVCPF
jgi:hypothetical protein